MVVFLFVSLHMDILIALSSGQTMESPCYLLLREKVARQGSTSSIPSVHLVVRQTNCRLLMASTHRMLLMENRWLLYFAHRLVATGNVIVVVQKQTYIFSIFKNFQT